MHPYSVCRKKLKSQARNYGRKWAPIFVHFAQFSLERALKLGIRSIYCFTREGIFFAKLLKEIQRVYTQRYVDIHIHILSISRLVSYGPSLDITVDTGFQSLFAIYPHQSMAGFFTSLGLSVDEFNDDFKKYGIQAEKIIKHLNRSTTFKDFISCAEIKEKVKFQLVIKRKQLQSYLAQQAFLQRSPVGVLDIGWRGSIQDNLARLFPDHYLVGFYLGLHPYTQPLLNNVEKHAYLYNANLLACDKKYARKMGVVLPFEFLFNTPGGTTIGYMTDSAGKVNPIASVVANEDDLLLEYAMPFQEGIMQEISTCLVSTHRPMTWRKIQARDRCLASTIVWNPPLFLLDYYDRLIHQEIFGLNQITTPPTHRLSKINYLWALLGNTKQRQQIKRVLLDSIWPQANLKKTFPFLYPPCIPLLKQAYLYYRNKLSS